MLSDGMMRALLAAAVLATAYMGHRMGKKLKGDRELLHWRIMVFLNILVLAVVFVALALRT